MSIEEEYGVKEIVGHSNYFVNNNGVVYSRKSGTMKELSRHYDRRGYWRIYVSVGGKPKGLIVHRLVAKAFIENPDNLPEVNHKDGNKNNNHYLNLEWCTKQQNEDHKRNVLGHDSKGSRNGNYRHRKSILYPTPKQRNRLCELGVPRYRHNLAELGEMLPYRSILSTQERDMWVCAYYEVEVTFSTQSPKRHKHSTFGETEAQARAAMLIYLLENNLHTIS